MKQRTMLHAGDRLGDYIIESYLGGGAFKEVYKAKNMGTAIAEPYVALAVPRRQDPETQQLIRQEYTMQCQLNHPNIVHVYEIAEDEDGLYLVMDYVEGESLASRLKRSGAPLDPELAMCCVGKLAEALAYTHETQVFHRDIKPANVIVTRDGTPKLIDFGEVRIMNDINHADTTVGMSSYLAPEIFQGQSTYSADIWALGIIFYELLTGKVPFQGENPAELQHKIMTEPLDTAPLAQAGASPQVIAIIRKMLEKRPEDRYPNVREIAEALGKVARQMLLSGTDEERLEILIRASFPLVHILSYEEERVLEAIRAIRERRAADSGKELKLYVWSASRGLRDEKDALAHPKTYDNPSNALKHLIENKQPAIYVFLDMHRQYSSFILHLVRDAARAVRSSDRSMLMISPFYSVLEELETAGSAISFRLPERQKDEWLVVADGDRVKAERLPLTLKLDRELQGGMEEPLQIEFNRDKKKRRIF